MAKGVAPVVRVTETPSEAPARGMVTIAEPVARAMDKVLGTARALVMAMAPAAVVRATEKVGVVPVPGMGKVPVLGAVVIGPRPAARREMAPKVRRQVDQRVARVRMASPASLHRHGSLASKVLASKSPPAARVEVASAGRETAALEAAMVPHRSPLGDLAMEPKRGDHLLRRALTRSARDRRHRRRLLAGSARRRALVLPSRGSIARRRRRLRRVASAAIARKDLVVPRARAPKARKTSAARVRIARVPALARRRHEVLARGAPVKPVRARHSAPNTVLVLGLARRVANFRPRKMTTTSS